MGSGNLRHASLAVFFLAGFSVGSFGAVAAEPPLADAGLDQTVEKGVTVYLDASGSRDPDGRLVAYDWEITSPSGDHVTPSCSDCARTTFVAAEPGRYTARATVTDATDRTASDTLYVSVSAGAAPTVRIRGPTRSRVGDEERYVAHATAGGANLSTLVWRVDGTVVERDDADGRAASTSLVRTFGRAASHTISVSAVDADGQTDSRSVTTRVRPRQTWTAPRDVTPVVDGPRLVTGAEPLRGTYRLNTGDGRWVLDGETVGRGSRVTVDLDPGTHSLYAVTDDGVANFADGTTGVVADPEPSVGFTELDGSSGLVASAVATDDFGNLVSLTIGVDGKEYAARSASVGDDATRLEQTIQKLDLEPGNHTIVARARDARGQTATARREIAVVGPPEVVRSEFVDGTVHAYDPRTDPERYAAHHVLVVDLNGMDAKGVEVVGERASSDIIRIDRTEYETRIERLPGEDAIRIHSFWAKDTPGKGLIKFAAEFPSTKTEWKHSEFDVLRSDPVIRLDVVFGGVTRRPTEWGMVVDASESFDPDVKGRGDISKLEFIWRAGASQSKDNQAIAKFDSFNYAGLEVRDRNGGKQSVDSDFLDYYTIENIEVSELTCGPYIDSETVRFRIRTERFRLTKNTFADYLDLALRSSSERLEVIQWQQHRSASVSNIHNPESGVYYTGTVEIPASVFTRTNPTITVFNTANPDYVKTTKKLPLINVTQPADGEVIATDLSNLSHLVEQPTYGYEQTTYPQVRDELVRAGYDIVRAQPRGTEYVIEERVKTQPVRYDNDTQRFQEPGYRRLFLLENPSWSAERRQVETREWTTTETEWRNTRQGQGAFTGRTRQVVTEPAEYRYLHEYKYQTRERKVGYRTDTRYTTVRDRHTLTRTVERCNRWIGCYESTETETYWRTRTIKYTVREPYIYWDYGIKTYWAESRYSYEHQPTGRTKTVLVQGAKYETQYEYTYEQHHKESIVWYPATKSILVSPAEFDWREVQTTQSRIVTKVAQFEPDIRIGERRPITEWTLRKQISTKQVWSAPGENRPEDVIKTAVFINQTIAVPYGTTNEAHGTVRKYRRFKVVFDGYLDAGSIKRRIKRQEVESMNEVIK